MPSPKPSTAFEYRQPIPVGRDTSLHRGVKESILNSLIEKSESEANFYFIHGPKYCGKTSLSNSIITTIDSRYSKKFLTVALKLAEPEYGTLVASICRQIFDQILQSMIELELLEQHDEIYQDWINKVDQTGVAGGPVNGLRLGNLVSNALLDPTKDTLINTSVLESDFRTLFEIIQRKRSNFNKFILFFDDFGKFKESAVEKVLLLLQKCSKVNVCINANTSYREYWELQFENSGYPSLDYPIYEPTEEELYILFYLELRYLNAPLKLISDAAVDDIYETANKDFRNFLIICYLIWQEVRAGRLEKFEINSPVLSGLISIAKKDSAPETINAIENTMKSSQISHMNRIEVLEVLAYKSLDLRDLTVIKHLPKVLDESALRSQMERYQNVLKLFIERRILIDSPTGIGHSGLVDPVVESYVRFHLRDEIRKEKNKLRYFLADDNYDNLMIAMFRRAFIYRILKPHSVTHSSISVASEEEVSWDLLEMVRNRDIFSIYAEQRGRNFDNALSGDEDLFGVLQVRFSIRGKQQVLMVSIMKSFGQEEPSLEEHLENWKRVNENLLSYLEFQILELKYELLGAEETQDLQALHKARDTESAMSAFRNRNYFLSRDEFVKQYTRIDTLLAKYSTQFRVKISERKNLLREIADLKVRVAFTDLLVGNIEKAIQTLIGINEDHLEDDISVWIYRDDLANAFAFSGDFARALQFSEQAISFFYTNIGMLPTKRGATLLQFVPDGTFSHKSQESEITRYHYETEEDSNIFTPVLLNQYLKCKTGLMNTDQFVENITQMILNKPETPDIPPLRSILWFLKDLVGDAGVKLVQEAVKRYRIPRDNKSKFLYDDFVRLGVKV